MNKLFLVKETKPAYVIGWVSVACGLAVFIGLGVYRRLDENCFLNQCGWLGDKLVRLVADIGVTIFTFTLMNGFYNLWKRRVERKTAGRCDV